MSDSKPKHPTAQWLDHPRKTEGVDRSPDWLSWIETCALFARAKVPMPTIAVTGLDRRKGHDGHWRYPRGGVEQVLQEAEAFEAEAALAPCPHGQPRDDCDVCVGRGIWGGMPE